MAVPKAFISYSHDSEEHKQWVFNLAKKLISKGVDVSLDLWDLHPGGDLPDFMERHLSQADKVLMVCTENYVRKANAGEGGVGYEKMIVTADLIKKISSSKVIPLIRQPAGRAETPVFLATKRYLNFADDHYEFSFDELVRTLHDAPLFVKPTIGERPDFDEPPIVEETGDPILLVMKAMVQQMEIHADYNYVQYPRLVRDVQEQGMSRLLLDDVIRRISQLGYIARSSRLNDHFSITEKGRNYALAHKLG